jgi:tetratricopeptide (TPR) repeat protein
METIRDLGTVYVRQNKLNDAEELYQQALRGYEKTLAPEHPAILNIFENLSSFYAEQHRLEEAEKMGLRALQGCEKILGPEHWATIRAVSKLGDIYFIKRSC